MWLHRLGYEEDPLLVVHAQALKCMGVVLAHAGASPSRLGRAVYDEALRRRVGGILYSHVVFLTKPYKMNEGRPDLENRGR